MVVSLSRNRTPNFVGPIAVCNKLFIARVCHVYVAPIYLSQCTKPTPKSDSRRFCRRDHHGLQLPSCHLVESCNGNEPAIKEKNGRGDEEMLIKFRTAVYTMHERTHRHTDTRTPFSRLRCTHSLENVNPRTPCLDASEKEGKKGVGQGGVLQFREGARTIRRTIAAGQSGLNCRFVFLFVACCVVHS